MKAFKRIANAPFEVIAENGDHFELEIDREYITSAEQDDGTVVVFSSFWVPVPIECFRESKRLTWNAEETGR